MSRSTRSATQTRDRLVAAAIEVFATEGLQGATTREIARVAEVNEVTLFRHFKNKNHLLQAVIERVLALQAETLSQPEEWTQDLRIDLHHYAQVYNTMLEAHEALIRTFIGEAKRHPEEARRVIQEAARPWREKLIAYLQQGQKRGTVRSDLDPVPTVDLLTGMLLAGMLRRCAAPTPLSYSRDCYIDTAVDVFVQGVRATHAAIPHPETAL
ncbi:MAG TPA: TetR/AcrR family transcriptional regulator [Allocoleopsis sp.]